MIKINRIFSKTLNNGKSNYILKASFWVFGNHIITNLFRLGCNLIITRLLVPELFGIMAIVNSILYGLQMFTDTGTNALIIRHKNGAESYFLNTVWSIQSIRGFVILCFTFFLAIPVSLFYAKPEISMAMPILGCSIFFRSLISTGWIAERKKLSYGVIVPIEMGCYLINVTTTIILAYIYPSIWSLVFGAVIQAVLMAVLSHFFLKSYNVRPAWNKEVVKESFQFGKWIFFSSILFFVLSQVDRLFIGKYASMELLGIYSIAFMFCNMFMEVITMTTGRIIFPVFSKNIQYDQADFKEKYYFIRSKLNFFFLIGGSSIVFLGPILIQFLYDERYHGAGPMLSFLILRAVLHVITYPTQSCFVSIGYPKYELITNSIRVIWLLILLPLAGIGNDLSKVLWIIGLIEVTPLFFLYCILAKHNSFDIINEMKSLIHILIGLSVGWMIKVVFETFFN